MALTAPFKASNSDAESLGFGTNSPARGKVSMRSCWNKAPEHPWLWPLLDLAKTNSVHTLTSHPHKPGPG